MPCEYFFIIQIELEACNDLPQDILLKKIQLKILDKTKNKTTNQLEDMVVDINRPLPNNESNTGELGHGIPLKRGG